MAMITVVPITFVPVVPASAVIMMMSTDVQVDAGGACRCGNGGRRTRDQRCGQRQACQKLLHNDLPYSPLTMRINGGHKVKCPQKRATVHSNSANFPQAGRAWPGL